MNLPDKIVEEICKQMDDNSSLTLKEKLFEYSEIYNDLIKQRGAIAKLKKEYDEQIAIGLKVVQSCQDVCPHIWEHYRSGVDSADNYSQCLVCGKYDS